MNYNRRATRPDNMFYRQVRKKRSGSGFRAVGGRTWMVVVAMAAVVAVAWWMLH